MCVVNSKALKMISDRIDAIQDSVDLMQIISIHSLFKNSYLILFIEGGDVKDLVRKSGAPLQEKMSARSKAVTMMVMMLRLSEELESVKEDCESAIKVSLTIDLPDRLQNLLFLIQQLKSKGTWFIYIY